MEYDYVKRGMSLLEAKTFLTSKEGRKMCIRDRHCVEATAVSKERDSYIFRAADSTEVMGLVVSGCVLVIQEDLWGHRNILSKCHARCV